MAEDTVLASTRAVPWALQNAGFRFQHPQLETALAAML
jgi:NAD dependent epimerase/dehydratase family enzyme